MKNDISAQFLYSITRDIVNIGPRVCGSKEERYTADFIANEFKKAGLSNISYESFGTRHYQVNHLSIIAHLNGDAFEIPSQPIWYTKGKEVKANAVSVGLGLPRDFRNKDVKDKVVIVESKILLNYYPTHSLLKAYHQAIEARASAFVVWMDAPYELAPRYNLLAEDEPEGAIPGILLSRGDGIFLDNLIKNFGSEVELEIKLDSNETIVETGDVVGYLPGSDDVIIIGSHYDSVYSGATDNAAGNAGLLALAHHVSSLGESKPTFVFCAHPGHEVNIGAREFIHRHDNLIRKSFLYLSIDGFGSSGYTYGVGGAISTGRDEKRGISTSNNTVILKKTIPILKKYDLLPAVHVPASQIIFNKDLEGRFFESGVPFLLIIGKPIWYHTQEDTIDKIKPDQLLRSYRAHAEILSELIEVGPQEIKKNDQQPYEIVFSSVTPNKIRWDEEATDQQTVSFGFLPEPAVVDEPAFFYVNDFSNSEEVIVDVEWDFGCGIRMKGPIASCIYKNAGKYEVTVSIINTAGVGSTAGRILWVVK